MSEKFAVGYEVQVGKPKTKRSERRIALDPTTVAALRRWRKMQLEERILWGEAWTDTGLTFTAEGGSHIHPDRLSKLFEQAVEASGVRPLNFHGLRHSFASAALQAGVHVKIVSERLGHGSIALTLDQYSHAIPGMDEEAAETVAALFG